MFNTEDFKKSVLDRAMRGKLTTQLPEDGDAKDLLNQIDAEKKALIKDKKIKAQKTLPEIDADEIPFEIPENWQWVRLGDITNMQIGKTPSRGNKEYWNGSIPWVSIRDINGDVLTETNDKITEQAAEDTFSNNIAPKGTMLMSFKLSIGKVCILNMPAYHNEAIVSFYFFRHEEVIKEYLFNTIGYLSNFAKSNSAVKGKTLNKTSLNNMIIPIPPISEQKRIVENIDKCFDLANHIDQEDSLTDKFNVDMRKSLLQSAMMGKLTKQLPEDGDASELLDQIKTEKEALVKAKKIKKQKPLPEIDADEIPFEIPDNWRWVRLDSILSFEKGAIRRGPFGSSITKAMFVPQSDNSYKVYEQGNAIRKSINYGNYYISKDKFNELESFKIKSGDIIVSCAGTIGKTYVLPENCPEGVINQALIRIRLNETIIDKQFFLLMFQQKLSLIQSQAVGSAIKNMASIKTLKNDILWQLPPLPEQKRIVNKLNKLFEELKG